MMADTFPLAAWKMPSPDWGFATTPQANITKTALGDGYEYREPKGLNYKSESFQPVWSNLDPTIGQTIYEWLFARLDLTAFKWQHPVTNKMYQVLASGLSIEFDTFNNAVIKVTFTQDFNPLT